MPNGHLQALWRQSLEPGPDIGGRRLPITLKPQTTRVHVHDLVLLAQVHGGRVLRVDSASGPLPVAGRQG